MQNQLSTEIRSIDYFQRKIEVETWPFNEYKNQIANLRNYFDIPIKIITSSSTFTIGGGKKSIIDIIDINKKYVEPSLENSIYPNSILKSDGSAINFKNILFIKREDIESKFSDSHYRPSSFNVRDREELETLLDDPSIIYKNLPLFVKSIQNWKEIRKIITEHVADAARHGAFD